MQPVPLRKIYRYVHLYKLNKKLVLLYKYGKKVKDKPKQELAALAFSAHLMKLPIIPTTGESLKQNVIDYDNLLQIDGTKLHDPFTIYDGWVDEKAGLQQWPHIFLSDIIEHAGVANNNIDIAKYLQQYKLGKGQSYIDSGHVQDFFLPSNKPCITILLAAQ